MNSLDERRKAMIRESIKALKVLKDMDFSTLSADELYKVDELNSEAKNKIGTYTSEYEDVIIENLGYEIDEALKSEVAVRYMESCGYRFVDSFDKITPCTCTAYPKKWELYRDTPGPLSDEVEETGKYKSPVKFVNFPAVPEEFAENYPSFKIMRVVIHMLDIRLINVVKNHSKFYYPTEVRAFLIFG